METRGNWNGGNEGITQSLKGLKSQNLGSGRLNLVCCSSYIKNQWMDFLFFFIRLFFFLKALQWFRQLMLRPVSRQLQSTAAIWQLHSGSAAASVDSWKLSGSVIARRRTWEWIFPSKPLSPDGRYGIKWMDRAEQRLNGMEDRLINSCWTF